MKKRLFMCVNYPRYNNAIGISKKIKMQIEAFERLGYNVTYSAYLENGVAICENDNIILMEEYKYDNLSGIFRRFQLMDICLEYLKKQKFDIGFVRWDAADPQFLHVLKIMKKNCNKILMDFHGYFPGYDTSGLKGKFIKYFTLLNGNWFQKYVDYGLTETKCEKLFNVRTLPVDTGIDVSKYAPHKYVGSSDEINMISVANETPYHGYNRVIYGVAEYLKENPLAKIRVHLVGKMYQSTEKLVEVLNLQDYIIFYGYKSGDELTHIYNMCNIGIGPLAPHRIGGKEGTGIKTKEYFAIGLPYFYAGQELLVPDDYPYVLKMDANDSPIDISKVVDFYDELKSFKDVKDNMREFAVKNYSWDKILSTALKNMEGR